jgi:hypothetical protein
MCQCGQLGAATFVGVRTVYSMRSRAIDAILAFDSSLCRFIEAAHGSQREFKQDRKARYLRFDGVVLRFLLQWRERRSAREVDDIQYWYESLRDDPTAVLSRLSPLAAV